MAKTDIFKTLYAKKVSALDFKWDTMVAPPLLSLITPQDIYELNQIARSNKLASKPEEKYKRIANILESRGFKKLASGTNRVVYKYLENQNYCLKVAFDRVGLKDNPMEFQNQFLLKPFVTRIFEISPCGTVALAERVEPITTREEYLSVINDVFDMLVTKIIGKYVIDDIGTRFFQNVGIRSGFGVVLLDFPYVYELDGGKMRCNTLDPMTGQYCLGEIDYDDGFNTLICTRCGKQYQARQLAKQVEKKSIVIDRKGETKAMKIRLVRGEETVREFNTENESNVLPRKKNQDKPMSGVKVLNKRNFDNRQARKEKNEQNRVEAVHDARDRRERRVKESINRHVDALNGEGKPFSEPPEVVEVDAAKMAAKQGMPEGRYPRAKATLGGGETNTDKVLNKIVNGSTLQQAAEQGVIPPVTVHDSVTITKGLDESQVMEPDKPETRYARSVKTETNSYIDAKEELENLSSDDKEEISKDSASKTIYNCSTTTEVPLGTISTEICDVEPSKMDEAAKEAGDEVQTSGYISTDKESESQAEVEEPVMEVSAVESEEDEDLWKDELIVTPDQAAESTYKNPIKVKAVVLDVEEDVSGMY
ncbi:MAG: hypothetical protein K2P14_03445 [Anaeroplasmataceae bacterium]|nr:hypothetical protein [Anaeroplasmataceae bacterium]